VSGTGDNFSVCWGKPINGTGDNYSLCRRKATTGTGYITIPCVGEKL
jgi:hypothetical protein